VDALLKEGMSVDLVCQGDGTEPKREARKGLDVRRITLANRRGGRLLYAYQYSAFLLISSALLALRAFRRRYDLVYVHNMPDVLVFCGLVPKLLGAKVILDMHDPMPELMTTIFGHGGDSFTVRLLKRFERWSMAFADAVITVNAACKRIFASRSCPDAKITVVMNSPDEEIFPLRPPQPTYLTEDTPARPFVVMYHGSLVERNGLDLAIEAFARVRETVPAAELRIYGRSTPFLQRMMREIQERGLQDAAFFLGQKRLDELVVEIGRCDVGVIPNHHNAFTEINTPTRIFEYLAIGKPVIVPRTSGITDYFGPRSLLFFEPGNSEDLAERIEYAYAHPQDLAETVSRGQQVYLEHTWSDQKAALLDVAHGLLNGDSPR
jgi:Glycosyltransferase